VETGDNHVLLHEAPVESMIACSQRLVSPSIYDQLPSCVRGSSMSTPEPATPVCADALKISSALSCELFRFEGSIEDYADRDSFHRRGGRFQIPHMLEVLLGMSLRARSFPCSRSSTGSEGATVKRIRAIAAGITCQFAMLRLALPVVPSFRGKPTRVTTAIGRYFPS